MAHKTFVRNGIGHFDVSGRNLSQLSGFYQNVFGWKAESKGPGYALVQTPDGSINGALIEAEEAALTIGITVPNLDDALSAAVVSGGSIVMPKTDNGWVTKGQIKDPAGNLLTLIQA